MTKRVLAGIAAMGCAVFASAQTTYPSGVTGCIARWNFSSNGTVASLPDVSGNGNNATIINLAASSGFRNTANAAMQFNGISSYAQAAHNTALNPQQLSIVALVRPTGFYSGLCQGNNIIYKGFNYNDPGVWAMYLSDADNNCSAFSPSTEVLDFVGAPGVVYPANNYINPNKWYLFVTTYGGDSLKRYQVIMDTAIQNTNVSPISVSYSGSPIGSTVQPVFIGATQHPSFPYWFNGDMDEIAFFNKVLTKEDVQSIYNYLWANPLSVEGINASKSLGLYPTISNGSFTVSTNLKQAGAGKFEVMDAIGQVVYSKEQALPTGAHQLQLDLPNSLASGTYLLRMTADGQYATSRFVIQH